MNKKIKRFWDDHKLAICIVGGTAAIAATLYLNRDKRRLMVMDITGKNAISWVPDSDPSKVLSLERVKEILDLNKDNLSQFAIFREGTKPTDYTLIVPNGNWFVE